MTSKQQHAAVSILVRCAEELVRVPSNGICLLNASNQPPMLRRQKLETQGQAASWSSRDSYSGARPASVDMNPQAVPASHSPTFLYEGGARSVPGR
jgi:hypothetical protein